MPECVCVYVRVWPTLRRNTLCFRGTASRVEHASRMTVWCGAARVSLIWPPRCLQVHFTMSATFRSEIKKKFKKNYLYTHTDIFFLLLFDGRVKWGQMKNMFNPLPTHFVVMAVRPQRTAPTLLSRPESSQHNHCNSHNLHKNGAISWGD